MAKVGGNQMPTLLRLEQKDFNEIDGHGFPWTLVLDREELDKFWPNVMLHVANPPVVVPIGPEFHISEPNWVGFTFHGIFYAFNILIF